MASSKINFPGSSLAHKKGELIKNPIEAITTKNQQTPQGTPQESQPNSRINTPKKKEQDFLNIYKGKLDTRNLEYIELLLKQKLSSKGDNNQNASKKKGHYRAKSNLTESAQKTQGKQQPNSPQSNRPILAVTPVQVEEGNHKPSPMQMDANYGFQSVQPNYKRLPSYQEQNYMKQEGYEGNITQRHLTTKPTATQKEEKVFEKFSKKDSIVRKSTSMEDLRTEKKIFDGNHNKSTLYNVADLGSDIVDRSPERSIHHDSRQSVFSPKREFLASLQGYIDYFYKSENMSYRNMKAGQYLRGNAGKSVRSLQKELDAANREIGVMRLQMQKLKWTLNEVLTENKMLTKEVKVSRNKDQEQKQLMQKMQEEMIHLMQKNHQYKLKCAHIKEMFKQERVENENNLLSLKQVLANINVALEQKTSPYKKEKRSELKDLLVENLFLKKDRETLNKAYAKQQKHLNGTTDGYGTIYETLNPRRSAGKGSPKRESSMLLSQKDSLSSTEEQEDGYYYQPSSNSNESENIIYETRNPQIPSTYASHRQNLTKKQQIKLLEEKLADLINNDEISFGGQTTCAKTSTKTSRGKHPHHRRNVSDAGIQNYYQYLSKERQNMYSNPTVAAKYSPHEQRSSVINNNYAGLPSLKDLTEGSFSST